MISNCSITKNTVNNANLIFEPELAGVRGRTVRRPPEPVHIKYVQIPRMIIDRHLIVTLAVDCMFVNGVPFLVSMCRGLNLITDKYTPSQTAKNLAAGISCIMELYAKGCFQVGTVLMDHEFESLHNRMPIIAINTTAARKHVPNFKCRIRLMKNHGRGILNTLPYKKIPQLTLIDLIYHIVLWLNAFPMKSGVSKILSSQEIVYGHNLDFAKH
jgi:hypothetical protein